MEEVSSSMGEPSKHALFLTRAQFLAKLSNVMMLSLPAE